MTAVTHRARGVQTRCYMIPAKGETSGKVFPVPDVRQTNETEGDDCRFDMLGTCDRRKEGVSGFFSSF